MSGSTTHGAGIFDNTLAQSVRADFEAALAGGLSVYAAADAILARHAGLLHDAEHAAPIFYALAVLQSAHGTISPRIRKAAQTLIVSGEGLAAFAHHGPEWLARRREVEQELRRKLTELG
jgi:hypothetical protein